MTDLSPWDSFEPADTIPLESAVISTSYVTAGNMPSPDQVQIQEPSSEVLDDEGQDLDMPPTPEFGLSPNTPTTTNSMKFPQTPASAKFELFTKSPSTKDVGVNFSPSYMRETRESEVDPKTIFVGGLEFHGPNAWDENRVKEYFSKYGGIEEVKYIVPSG